jgi:predicted aspartyl protease
MGRVSVEITVANNGDVHMAEGGSLAPEKVRRVQILGTVDTGANHLVLPESVVQQLGLPLAGEAIVRYADRRTANRPLVEEVRAELLGRHGTFRAIVEPDRTTALIGAIVLEDLDLLVDCTTQTLQPRDPNRIIAEIE